MANFSFVRQTIFYNSETTFANLTNTSSGPYFIFSQLNVVSPTGCPYFLIKVYKNNIRINTYSTSTINQGNNSLSIPISILLEPGSSLSISFTNLDPLQQNHDVEGSLF